MESPPSGLYRGRMNETASDSTFPPSDAAGSEHVDPETAVHATSEEAEGGKDIDVEDVLEALPGSYEEDYDDPDEVDPGPWSEN